LFSSKAIDNLFCVEQQYDYTALMFCYCSLVRGHHFLKPPRSIALFMEQPETPAMTYVSLSTMHWCGCVAVVAVASTVLFVVVQHCVSSLIELDDGEHQLERHDAL